MQRTTRKPYTYKRAALLLLVLPIRIDSRRNTPTLYTLSSVPYRPRIPTPRKDNQRATYTPQPFAPSTGQALHSSSCVLSCLLSCTHTTNAATLSRFTLGRIATNAANGSTTKRQPLHLTHSPTIQRRKASRNHCRLLRQPGQFRPAEHKAARLAAALATICPPGPYQPPQRAPTGQHFPLSCRIFADDPPQRAPALLRACLHIYARMYEFLHIRNENYIPYSTCTRKPLILPGFKARDLCTRRQKLFTLGNRARNPLILPGLRTLHKQPIFAFLTIYRYINSNLCRSML